MKLPLWKIQRNFRTLRTSLEFRLQNFAFSPNMTKKLPIFFISEWISFDLIETTSIFRCCVIFNAVAQTATLSSFVRMSLRISQ